MKLLGRSNLSLISEHHVPEIGMWLRSWVAEIAAAHWRSDEDVRLQFPTVRMLGKSRFSFQIHNTEMLLLVLITFSLQSVLVLGIERIEHVA